MKQRREREREEKGQLDLSASVRELARRQRQLLAQLHSASAGSSRAVDIGKSERASLLDDVHAA